MIMVKGSLLEVEVMGLMQKDEIQEVIFLNGIEVSEAQIAGTTDIYQKNGVLPVLSIVMEMASWMQRMQLQQA